MRKIMPLCAVIVAMSLLSACRQEVVDQPYSMNEYRVLIGEEADIVGRVQDVELLVIDAEYFSAEDIAALKENGVQRIYSYLNLGSIENFRDYYGDYVDITLGDYEDWPEEKWVDVSQEKWRVFLRGKADELAKKGISGFFVDNTDVYYMYPEEGIYNGIVAILQDLKDSGLGVMINGGDAFVTRYLESGEGSLFDAVNQENVYTMYDFDKGRYGVNSRDEREYFTEYLDLVLEHGCKAYTLEYATDSLVAEKALEYSMEHGYICYVADNIELKME